MTNIKNLDTNLLAVNQITFTNTNSVVCGIEYFKNLDSINFLYLVYNDADAYFECIDENKYLAFALTDKSREALENYKELWSEIKYKVECISVKTIKGIECNSVEPIKYEKNFMKIKFESDDDLPLGKVLNIPICVITAKSVFQENDKYYPQVHLKDLL